MTTYKQERVGDFITTYTGQSFYVTNPNPDDVQIEDIAHALSQFTRFTGHTRYKFYSVGEHSVLCSVVADFLGLSPRLQLIALLHDASEAYCGDVNRPLKQELPQYKNAEDKIMNAIWRKYNLFPTDEEYHTIKKIDNTLLVAEMKQLMYRDEVPDVERYSEEEVQVFLQKELSMEYVKTTMIEMFEALLEECRDGDLLG